MKIQNNRWWVLAFVSTLLLLGACKSSKQIVVPLGKATLNKRQFIGAYQSMKEYPIVDANGKFTIITEGKKNINLGNIGFRWSLERDKAFVFSLRPMSIMEAGKLSIDNQRLLILDRMGKHAFMEENLGNSLLLLKNVVGINTNIFKALIQNQPFELYDVGSHSLQRMDFRKDGKHYFLTDALRPGGHRIVHTFDAALNLVESRVTIVNKAEVKISYWDFVRLDDQPNYRPVPSVIRIDVETMDIPANGYHLQMNLDRLKQTFSQKVETEIPRGYKQVTLVELIDLISSL